MSDEMKSTVVPLAKGAQILNLAGGSTAVRNWFAWRCLLMPRIMSCSIPDLGGEC